MRYGRPVRDRRDNSFVSPPPSIWTPSRRDFLKAAGAGLSLVTVGPILEACAGGSTSVSGKSGGTIQTSVTTDITQGLDPYGNDGAPSTHQILNLVYETLVTVQDDTTIGPGIAKSWEHTSDTSYTFHLRDGVKFSNGRQLTADDVVGSLKRMTDPKVATLGWAGQLGAIASVTAVDAATVKVELAAPYTQFLAALAFCGEAAIIPIRELNAGTFDPAKDLLGSGPFMLDSHVQGTSWSFKRNPNYWRTGYPKADRVVMKVLSDESARIAALRDGSTPIIATDNPEVISLFKSMANVEVVVQRTADYYRLDINAVAPNSPFRDIRVRQAFTLGIDRAQIRDLALGGIGEPTGPIAPAFNIVKSDQLRYVQHNPQMAKDLLQQAGVPNLKFDLIAAPVFPASPKIAQVIQQNLAQIGVTVNVLQLDTGVAVQRCFGVKPGNFDAAIWSLVGYGDPAMVPAWWNPVKSEWNSGFLRDNSSLDTLITEAQTEPIGAGRTATLVQLSQGITEQANMLSLVTKPWVVAYRKDLITPKIQPIELYTNALRHIQEYSLVNP